MTQTTDAPVIDTIDVREILTARGPQPDVVLNVTEALILRDGLTVTPRECNTTDGSGAWTEITMPSIEDVEILLIDDPVLPEWTISIDASERFQPITIAEGHALANAIRQACVVAEVLPARVRA